MYRVAILILFLLQGPCSSQVTRKINGVSFVASREEVAGEHIQEVVNLNANYAAVMPFGFIRDTGSPEIIFDTDRQWFGETRKGAAQYIQMLQKNGIRVMMKPQIWLRHGVFTGKLQMQSEEDWKILEQSYEDFIMSYAEVARDHEIALFCIGTELEQFVHHRPAFWKALIQKVRGVFKGEITYAANWDEYPRVSFWEEVDYIGIDAYFPLSGDITPSVEQLRAGWEKYKGEIKALSDTVNKPVLFTEYGYRSMDYTAKKPWLVESEDEKVNLIAQVNATRAILEEFWVEEWFEGGFVWKWFISHKQAGGEGDNRFTPQNKPAQMVIRDFYNDH